VIPIRDDVPVRSLPVTVTGLVALNVAAFLYTAWLAAGPGGDARVVDWLSHWGLVPRELLRAESARVWITPVSAMFLHGGLLHLAGNAVYLCVFGTRIEDLLGAGRFLLFYLVCGLAAAAAHVASTPGSWTVTLGASGAISGALGAYAVSYPTGRLRLLWPRVQVPAFAFLLVWIAIQLVSGVGTWGADSSPVAWWAHLGGFAAGVALGRPMWVRKPTRSRLRI
jgi:membrane associated rhomboid family serine protease